MSLRSERTKWVMFLPCSGAEAEIRHVLDLVFGVFCLERAGIQSQDIFIYIDSPDNNYDGFFGLASTHGYVSKSTSEFFSDMEANTYDNLVMFVTGHGGPFGLDANPCISPNKLITSLKSTPNLRNAVIYLGQCYAGTFNYVNAGKTRDEVLDIILVGATNLNQSLSTGTTEVFPNHSVPIPWVANVFLLFVFKWMSSPQDIDGDGVYTIMDSYKYAGVYSNESNKQSKTNGFVNVMDMLHDYIKARDILKEKVAAQAQAATQAQATTQAQANAQAHIDADVNVGVNAVVVANEQDSTVEQVEVDSLVVAEAQADDIDDEVDLKAKEDLYLARLALHHVHQECWILNSRPAQLIQF